MSAKLASDQIAFGGQRPHDLAKQGAQSPSLRKQPSPTATEREVFLVPRFV